MISPVNEQSKLFCKLDDLFGFQISTFYLINFTNCMLQILIFVLGAVAVAVAAAPPPELPRRRR